MGDLSRCPIVNRAENRPPEACLQRSNSPTVAPATAGIRQAWAACSPASPDDPKPSLCGALTHATRNCVERALDHRDVHLHGFHPVREHNNAQALAVRLIAFVG